MPRLALTLCGHVAVDVDGHPPPGAPLGAKPLALLAYLALEPGAHAREQLTALLWGDFPEAKARASLRQALLHLRQALGDALDVSRTSVALVAPVECDVLALRDDAAAGALRLDLTHFLGDLPVRHCASFDEWADATRRRLLRRAAVALADLARGALARLDWAAAATAADRWLAADPFSDDAARVAVEARHLAGDAAAAHAVYEEYRARLDEQRGAVPGRALRALAERVAQQVASATSRRAPAAGLSVAPSFDARLRGREREWAILARSWRATVEDGLGSAVLVEGGIGVGKTRLVGDFARWVVGQHGTVLRGDGHEADAVVPFGRMAAVLRSALDAPGLAGADGQWLAELSRLVPQIRSRLPGVPPAPAAAPAEGWRLFEAAAQLLAALAAERPVCVLLDAVEWCDADSAALVQFLLHRTSESPVLWCATLTLGAVERGAPGERLGRALRSAPRATTIRPAPLGEIDVAELVAELGHLPDTPTLRWLARHVYGDTAGNPLYVTELLRALFERGVLTLTEDGAWRLSPALDNGARESLVGVDDLSRIRAPIVDRIGRLPDDARDLLVTIAVADDDRCDADVLSHVHGVSRLRAAALGEALLERALVTEEGGAYRCAHPVIGRVVRANLSGAWRREVERAIALTREAAPTA